MSPFEHVEDLVSVEPLDQVAKHVGGVDGVQVVLRGVPGLTEERLRRVIECHLARNASLGHDVSEMGDCPLVPRGVEARVRTVPGGFAVEMRAADARTANELLERARRLLERRDGAPSAANK